MPGGQYKIYRAYTSGGLPTNYNHIATINISGGEAPETYSYTDFDVCGAGAGSQRIYYTVSAVDNTSKESVKAVADWVPWNGVHCKESYNFQENIITEYKLHSNYPNPFNPITTIQFDIVEKGLVELKVYDILGKRISVLVNDIKEPGIHFAIFNSENLPSGIYIYTIKVNNFISNQKMMILK